MNLHLTSAALLPPIDHMAGVVSRVAAMARPPRWVIDITSGRPRHGYAVGFEAVLMDAAIAERANPLLSQGGSAWEGARHGRRVHARRVARARFPTAKALDLVKSWTTKEQV